MKYWGTENVVRVGDRVLYNGTPGVIVFVIDDDSYSDRYPKEHWSYLGTGLGVELQDETRTLYHLGSSEEEEDLEPANQ
jgi:hypothetical protein